MTGETMIATIARVNGRGFQTREDPGKWFNLSRYQAPAPAIPPVGTEVRITLDGAGYVRAIETADDGEENNGSVGNGSVPPSSEKVTSIRIEALKCACRLLGPETETARIVAFAAKLEDWITR
jgi:hypothetical protein